MTLLFSRYQESKTPKFTKALIVSLCVIVLRYTPQRFVQLLEEIQPGMFIMALEKVSEKQEANASCRSVQIIVKEMNRVAYNGTRIERRTVAVAVARLLVESTDACSANGQRVDVWRDALAECVELVGGRQLKQSIIATNDEQCDENEFVSVEVN